MDLNKRIDILFTGHTPNNDTYNLQNLEFNGQRPE